MAQPPVPVKIARRAACDARGHSLDREGVERFNPFHRVVAGVQFVTKERTDREGKLGQKTGPAAAPAEQDHRLAVRERIRRSVGSASAPLLIHIRDLYLVRSPRAGSPSS